jgi:glycosyltransferase involved in cell wall biosynthesis
MEKLAINERSFGRKVLLVGMLNSIHVARWLEQFKGNDVEFLLFPSTPIRALHPRIRALVVNDSGQFKLPKMMNLWCYPLGLFDYLLTSHRLTAPILRRQLEMYKPDIVHLLELQHAGYLYDRAIGSGIASRKVIATNWGSDVYWYRRFPRHLKRIESLLTKINSYSAECARDLDLVKQLGYTGPVLPVIPNTGGIEPNKLVAAENRERKIILIKGYTKFVGRAEVALEALSLVSDSSLEGFEICIYSASRKIRKMAKRTSQEKDIVITCVKPHALSHNEMLELFSKAYLYVGISESDGISTSLLEAMASGTFPIQSSTSCGDEWIKDSITGFLVQWDSPQDVAKKIEFAISNRDFVSKAVAKNLMTIKERVNPIVVSEIARSFYE